jgi:hypothetical protein
MIGGLVDRRLSMRDKVRSTRKAGSALRVIHRTHSRPLPESFNGIDECGHAATASRVSLSLLPPPSIRRTRFAARNGLFAPPGNQALGSEES